MKRAYCLFFCLFLLVISCRSEKTAKTPPPPPEVKVIKTEAADVPIYQEFVGQLFGLKDIAIRARVEGFLEGIHFKEGSRVKKGDLLYTMESQPFEADVAARMSGVAEAKTMLAKAKSDLGRIRPLAAEKAVSQSDLDGAVARYEAAIAMVEAAQANLKASRILLGYSKLYSPLTGIIGKTQARSICSSSRTRKATARRCRPLSPSKTVPDRILPTASTCFGPWRSPAGRHRASARPRPWMRWKKSPEKCCPPTWVIPGAT